MATQHAHGAIAKELLNKGAKPDATTARGFTPLMLAAQYDQQDLVMDLLDRGALWRCTAVRTTAVSLIVVDPRTYVDVYAQRAVCWASGCGLRRYTWCRLRYSECRSVCFLR